MTHRCRRYWLLLLLQATFLLLPCINSAKLKEIPNCNYEDTANITGAEKFANGSYRYEKLIIPANLVGMYDYEILYEGERLEVPLHTRACICKLKPCIKFCCHPTQMAANNTRECVDNLDEELEYSPYVNITLNNGSMIEMHVLDKFSIQQGIPCEYGYSMIPQNDPDFDWILFENGTLLRLYDMTYMSRRDYCLNPYKVDDIYILNPLNCPVMYEAPTTEVVNSSAMLISIPFLVATIFVYLFVPKLRNIHGKCLICYLTCLAIGSSILAYLTLTLADISVTVCFTIGHITYYAFMAAFFWLSVISFDLWHNFCGSGMMHRRGQKRRFYVYSLYAWSIPLVLTAVSLLMQLSNLSPSLKSGIGDEHCWITPYGWSAMIHFYGPVLIIIIFNIIMFTLTSLKIYQVKNDLKRMNDSELSKQKDNFSLFLRLFIIMGITWLLEILSYICGDEGFWKVLFWVSDFCNATQGIIIFATFVLRRNVLLLIKKRIFMQDDETTTDRSSFRNRRSRATSRTMSSTVPLSLTTPLNSSHASNY